jgi:hypothetical protein
VIAESSLGELELSVVPAILLLLLFPLQPPLDAPSHRIPFLIQPPEDNLWTIFPKSPK